MSGSSGLTLSHSARETRFAMSRLHLFELHEQEWFPSFLRDEVTDALQFGLNLIGNYGPIAPLVQQALRSARSQEIVDMCSGGGGPWLDLSRRLGADADVSIQVVLTDKYPNLAAFEIIKVASGNRISFHPDPVDAAKVPAGLKGFRTLFTSFHHFSPEEARAVLQNAVDAGQGVGIFEITRRGPLTILLMSLWVFMLFVLTPLIRPFRWSRLFWTYAIPVIPVVLLLDGVVSCLRTYRPKELREIVAKLDAERYEWQIGDDARGRAGMPVTYLIGYPQAVVDSHRASGCAQDGIPFPRLAPEFDAISEGVAEA
jgi:hypothetical protein